MRTATPAIRVLCVSLVVGCVGFVSAVRQSDTSAIKPSAAARAVGAQTIGSGAIATAIATTPADRGKGPQPTSACQQVAYNVGQSHPGSTQVVVVLAPTATSSSGTLQVAQMGVLGWECGATMPARVGMNGVRPLLQRRSGDGTTPAGVFPLGLMTAWDGQQFSSFGNSADPGVTAGPYRRVRAGDCFGATPNHRDYGHLVFRSAAACPGPDDEYLPAVGSTYEHAVLIGANMEPNVSGDADGEIPYASAIFLHRFSYEANGNSKPTSGCVSLNHANLVSVLRALQPGALFAIGDTAWLLANS